MEYDKKPEKDWVEGLRAGDENAYRYLYQRHYKVLCAFAYSYVNDYFVAETLVSDVIFAIWNNREEIRIIQSLRAYLMRAVKNSCINHLEYCARQDVLRQNVGKQMELRQQSFDEQDNYPLCSILERELEEKITRSIDSLSDLTREIFRLSRFEKVKYEEIACAKGITIDVVKYHIRLAIKKLKEDLKDYLPLWMILHLFS